MVIGDTFAWGHLQKTGGNTTLEMFHLFPDLVRFADPRNTEAKHSSFGDRNHLVRGKYLVANIRRLPPWALSWSQHLAHPKREKPIPMASPHQMAHSSIADRFLLRLTNERRFRVDRWLRMEALTDDFLDFVEELTDVTEDQKKQIFSLHPMNAINYDREVGHWFTKKHVASLYENNPVWASVEREVYGGLMSLGAPTSGAGRGQEPQSERKPESRFAS
jgi:hypothetical protein